jgi:hypothetical protein
LPARPATPCRPSPFPFFSFFSFFSLTAGTRRHHLSLEELLAYTSSLLTRFAPIFSPISTRFLAPFPRNFAGRLRQFLAKVRGCRLHRISGLSSNQEVPIVPSSPCHTALFALQYHPSLTLFPLAQSNMEPGICCPSLSTDSRLHPPVTVVLGCGPRCPSCTRDRCFPFARHALLTHRQRPPEHRWSSQWSHRCRPAGGLPAKEYWPSDQTPI